MPEGAKVFLVEDNDKIRELERKFLEAAGHKAVLEAASLLEVLEKIEEAKKIGVNVGIIDSSLVPHDPNNKDGFLVAQKLREEIPGIKIISFTGLIADWGDINLTKPTSIGQLGTTVTNI